MCWAPARCPELQGGPSTALLESFPNRYPRRPYVISITFPEFTSLCPVTGQPDMGTITVEYIPDRLCVESKSFKLYMFAFRNHQSFMETITNTVLEDLWTVLAPCWCRVRACSCPVAARASMSLPSSSRTCPRKGRRRPGRCPGLAYGKRSAQTVTPPSPAGERFCRRLFRCAVRPVPVPAGTGTSFIKDVPMSLSHGDAPRPSGGGRMARTAGMLALFTLFSRLLGLVRDMGMAWLVGCGPVADALVAALRLPHLLRRLLGEGSLSMTLTAWLVRHDVAHGREELLPALASGLLRRLVLALGGLVLLGMLAAPQLLAFLAPALPPRPWRRAAGCSGSACPMCCWRGWRPWVWRCCIAAKSSGCPRFRPSSSMWWSSAPCWRAGGRAGRRQCRRPWPRA